MTVKSKTITRCLVTGVFLALTLAGCAPRTRIVTPPPPRDEVAPASGDRQTYQAAEYLARTGAEKAPEALGTFIAKFPESPLVPRALMRLGDVHQARGDLSLARQAYRRLLTDYGQDPLAAQAAVETLATYYREGDFKSLLARSDAVEGIPLDDVQRRRVGQMRIDAFLALGRNAEAVGEAIDTWPSVPETERAGLAEKLTLAMGTLSPEAMAQLLARPLDPERKRLVEELAVDRHSLGCLLPLSGAYAAFGQRALRGIEMALARFTGQPAAPAMRMVVEDTQSRPELAAAAVQALAARRVAVILGPMVTATQAAAEAQSHRIPIVTFTQREGIPAIGDCVFRHFITAQAQAEALVRWAIERRLYDRFAVLYPAEKYGQTFLAQFADAVQAHGAKMVGMAAYDPAGTDFVAPMEKLARLRSGPDSGGCGFDALFIPDEASKAGLIIPHLAFHDIAGFVLLGTNLWQSRTLIEMADKAVEGAVFPTPFFPDDPDPAVAEFVAAFRADYGEEPGFVEAVAYDTAMICLEILARPRVRSRDQVREALASGSAYTGVTGRTVFDASGEARKSLSLITIQNGRFSILDRVPATSDTPWTTLPAP